MTYKKKLIEVALPLEAINAASAREKSIRHGHPSTLHLWWSRKPTATARAVIWASLVDDPSSLPEQFPTEEAQAKERKRLFAILGRLIKWENSNNPEVLAEANAEIKKSTNGSPPALFDPFAGGGSIPLEAQRLGLEAHASDLNPVAVMINKAMIEIPPKFTGQAPVNPEARNQLGMEWPGATGLAEDVRYYGEWMKQKAYERIGHLYPTIRDGQGQERTIIAWIWARTVKCPNPACGCEMPLTSSFALSRKKGQEVHVKPIIEKDQISYRVVKGKAKLKGTVNRRGASCIACGTPVGFPYIREEGKAARMSEQLIAVVAEGKNGRLYFAPDEDHIRKANVKKPEKYPSGALSGKAKVNVGTYGFEETGELFTNRQLVALTAFSELIAEAQARATADAVSAGINDNDVGLSGGGAGTTAYGQAVGVYLSIILNRMADRGSTICSWDVGYTKIRNTFGRQAIPMTWDYAEANPFCDSTGSFSSMVLWVVKVLRTLPPQPIQAVVKQFDAQSDIGLRNIMVSTDPPYYDNISYGDLSDFFYVWLRYNLQTTYPDMFRTMLVPKADELVATPHKFDGSRKKAYEFFEDGMLRTCKQISAYVRDDLPTTVYYAYKQSKDDANSNTSSSGWETMLTAIVEAGFSITGTWPIRTEMANRSIASGANALASSIVLVCRKRPADAPVCTRRDFINALKRELKPALAKLQASNIAPVDMAQSAIGPGMGVYSRYSQVLEADGTSMSVRSALQIINQELDLYFSEQDGELDRDSRFCVDLFTQYAFNDVKFGEADVLARAKNTSVEGLGARGVLYAQKGVVRLLTREEIPEKIDKDVIWLLTQQLTRALEKDGVTGAAKIVAEILTSEPEQAKALAYRLFTIAERKGWASEAYAYNSLVIEWPAVQAMAAELQVKNNAGKQMTLFDTTNN